MVKGPTDSDFREICRIINIPNSASAGQGLSANKTSCSFTPTASGNYQWFLRAGYSTTTGGGLFYNYTDSEKRSFSLAFPSPTPTLPTCDQKCKEVYSGVGGGCKSSLTPCSSMGCGGTTTYPGQCYLRDIKGTIPNGEISGCSSPNTCYCFICTNRNCGGLGCDTNCSCNPSSTNLPTIPVGVPTSSVGPPGVVFGTESNLPWYQSLFNFWKGIFNLN